MQPSSPINHISIKPGGSLTTPKPKLCRLSGRLLNSSWISIAKGSLFDGTPEPRYCDCHRDSQSSMVLTRYARSCQIAGSIRSVNLESKPSVPIKDDGMNSPSPLQTTPLTTGPATEPMASVILPSESGTSHKRKLSSPDKNL